VFVEEFVTRFREKVAFIDEDKVMYPEIEKAVQFLQKEL